jgi:hypothetical protein
MVAVFFDYVSFVVLFVFSKAYRGTFLTFPVLHTTSSMMNLHTLCVVSFASEVIA